MKQTKWFERKFDFNSSQDIFPALLERLTGTPARLEEKIKSISPALLEKKPNDTWSIKENIGHLTDLEPLWQGRLEDISNNREEMRPTDLSNKKTDEANHNSKPVEILLSEFREIRRQTLLLLQDIDEELILKSALHPRLKTPMRTIDLFLFVAEHDDHHLARITEISKTISLK